MFLVLVKKGKIHVWMIVSKKSGVGQKLAHIQKDIFRQTQSPIWVAYSDKLQMEFNTAIY